MNRASSPALAALLLLAAACQEPMIKAGDVWVPEDQCWDRYWLEEPIPFISEMWEVYTVDERGRCWYFDGTNTHPPYWGWPPISVEEACRGAIRSAWLDCNSVEDMPW